MMRYVIPKGTPDVRKYIMKALSNHSAMGTDITKGCQWAFELTENISVTFESDDSPSASGMTEAKYQAGEVMCNNPDFQPENDSDVKCIGYRECGLRE